MGNSSKLRRYLAEGIVERQGNGDERRLALWVGGKHKKIVYPGSLG